MSEHYNLIRLTSTRQLLQKHNQLTRSTAALYGNLSYRMSKEAMQNSSTTPDGSTIQSGLIMSYGARAWEGKPVPDGTDDSILTAQEIAALDLSGTDVVVRSGCNTALGEITTEGGWGLQRAF